MADIKSSEAPLFSSFFLSTFFPITTYTILFRPIWLAKYNTAVFVNGCFWHRHFGCKYAYMPKSRVEFWEKKFRNNMERDTVVRHQLQEEGVRMLIIWECTVKSMIKDTILRERVLDRIDSFMRSEESYLEL